MRASKSALGLIFLTIFIDLLGFGIVMPLLPRYGQHFNLQGAALGMLMASFSLMQFLFAPIWGRISDRVGRRPILLVGLAGSTLFYGLFGYATSLGSEGVLLGLHVVPWLFICRIGQGLAGATIPTAQAYIADVTGPEQRARGMAMIGAAFGLGFTFGPILGAMFIPESDAMTVTPSAIPGYVASVLSGIAFLLALMKLPESRHATSGTAVRHAWIDVGAFARFLQHPAIGSILIATFMTTFAFAQFESTLALLTEYFKFTDRQNFLVFAYIGFILTLSQGFLVRRLVPVLGEKRMAIIGTTLMMIGFLFLLGLLQVETKVTWMLYAILPLPTVGFSFLNPSLQSLLSRHTAEDQQGGALGVGQSMSALARIAGPVCGIYLHKQGESLPYLSAAMLMAIGIVMVSLLKPPPAVENSFPPEPVS